MKQSLSLDNRRYQKKELLELCAKKLNSLAVPNWETALYLFIQTWLNAKDTVDIKTSGSTGAAKSIVLSKQAMRQSARMTGHYFQLEAGQNALLCLPTTHIAGQMMVVRAFELGLNLLTTAPTALELNKFGHQHIDFAAMLPLQLHKALFSNRDNLGQIKTLLIGGASISYELIKELQPLKTVVHQSYGMTETVSHIAMRRLAPQAQPFFYKLLEGVSIEQDARGCLIIHAPRLGVETLVTNDLVTLHSATEFEWLGRFDNVINSGGIKFNPEQLEAKLAGVIIDRQYFISGQDDEKLGQKLVLFIEGEPLSNLEFEDLQSRINTALDKYERPKAVFFVSTFEQTSTGKIKRHAGC